MGAASEGTAERQPQDPLPPDASTSPSMKSGSVSRRGRSECQSLVTSQHAYTSFLPLLTSEREHGLEEDRPYRGSTREGTTGQRRRLPKVRRSHRAARRSVVDVV